MSQLSQTNNPSTTSNINTHAHDTENLSISSTLSDPVIIPSSKNSLSHLVTNVTSSIPESIDLQEAKHISLSRGDIPNTSTVATNMVSAAWLEWPKIGNIFDFFSVCCSTAVIFGGLVPYIPQYLKIKRSMNSDGFSTYVCLTLLIANILRIMFWFNHRFELPLLIQSFVMIIVMMAMMEICIRVKNKDSPYTISAIGINANQRRRTVNGKMHETNECAHDNNSICDSESMPIYSVLSASSTILPTSPDSISFSSYHNQLPPQTDDRIVEAVSQVAATTSSSSNSSSSSSDSPITNDESSSQLCQTSLLPSRTTKCSSNLCDFWDWDDYYSYVKFLSLFTFIISLLTYLLKNNNFYVESLGFVAVFTESMLGMPQLLRNHAKKSTTGMSVEMVIMWLSGDLFKTLYFILRQTPIQFYVCGSIQVVVDILILCQVLLYRRPNVTYRKLPKST